MGSLAKDVSTGAMVVGPDFRLSCIDIVSQPSGPGCYAEGLFEDVEDAPDYYLNEDTGEWEPEEGEDTVADEIQEDDDVQIFMNYLTSLEEKAATLDENLHAIGEYLETVDGNVRAVAESQTNLLEGADILLDEYHEHLLEGMEALSGDQDELLENQYQLVENQNDLAEHHDNLVDLIIGLAKSLGKEEELRKIAARIQGNAASSSGNYSDVVSRSVEGNAERNRAANRGRFPDVRAIASVAGWRLPRQPYAPALLGYVRNHRGEIETWRSTLPPERRVRLNHPRRVLMGWKASRAAPNTTEPT